MKRFYRIFLGLLLIWGWLDPAFVRAAPAYQTETPDSLDVGSLVASMTPQEKIGQLFLVTFKGTAVDAASPIFQLITQYHVGGVVLRGANDNFADQDFATSANHLATNLQAVAAGVAPTSSGTPTPSASTGTFVPLFVATSYNEASLASRLLLPTPMTLGATWSLQRATTIGRLAGQDFSAMGVNLLFGPPLDVVATPQPLGPADQGAQTFGGNPYWVGKMGQAYITGIHQGSQNHVAVVAQHFPGYGAGDRTIDDQIPSVNRSRADLLSIDLAPFFQVAHGQASDADAFLVSHIRYSGLQGPLNDAVRPISLDQQALSDLLNLPNLAPWRANGGVTIADALGSRAIRRYQDPSEKSFSAFAIARDAFLAGNDLLYVSGFESSGDDPAATLKGVLAQFVQKYQEDASFASRVNEAVTRIVSLKKKLYSEFSFENVVSVANGLDLIGSHPEEMLATTQLAASLLSPTGLNSRPTRNQQVAFITDTRLQQTCTSCALQPTLAVDALQMEVLRLYGPRGTGEANIKNLTSISFVDVANFLDNKVAPTETPVAGSDGTEVPTPTVTTGVEDTLRKADWVVFSMLDMNTSFAESLALRRLLSQRPDLLRGKQVVVFAFDAPYYLDATEVSQLTAYYALYNHTPAAVQVAAQILFQEITPANTPPVSIAGTGYNLNDSLQPDPNQDIKLNLASQPTIDATPLPGNATATPSPIGVSITLQTSPIVDRRGHPVPDGTLVNFYVTYVSQGITNPIIFAEAFTVDGVATASYVFDKIGTLELSAASGAAQRSVRFRYNVTGPDDPGTPTIVPPATLPPTASVTPSITPSPSSTPEATATPTGPVIPSPPVGGSDLFMMLVTLAVMGGIALRLTHSRAEAVSDGVKLILVISIGALVTYNYYALKMPGYEALKSLGFWAVPIVVWFGGLLGFGVGWWWLRRSAQKT